MRRHHRPAFNHQAGVSGGYLKMMHSIAVKIMILPQGRGRNGCQYEGFDGLARVARRHQTHLVETVPRRGEIGVGSPVLYLPARAAHRTLTVTPTLTSCLPPPV